MGIAEVVSSRAELLVDGSMLLNGYVNESDDTGNDSASYEKSLLDEMDSYWEDLNARLTVSRMVSDSIIKGMVNAIEEEATEKITLKEAEVAVLNERLQYYESSADNSKSFDLKLEPRQQKMEMLHCSLDLRQEFDFVKQLDRLRIAAEDQLQRLPERASKDLVSEQQWREGIRREIGGIMIQGHIRSLQDEIETRICEQQSLMDAISKNWKKRVNEISSMRQDLDAIYGSLSNSDSGLLISQGSIENIEERNSGKRKDNIPWKIVGNHLSPTLRCKESGIGNNLAEKSEEFGKLMPNESPQLMCMAKEELITYFKTEMNKMKRQHELALQEKTEELFSLKRDLLKEKGSGPLHFSKEKDFEIMKKKISELISKLDDILLENKELPIVFDDQDILHRLKERIDTFFLKNQWLQGLLVNEKKEVRCIVSQVSTEPNSIGEIERLHMAIEEVKMEATIKEEKYKSVLNDLLEEIERDKQGVETVTKILDDNYCTIYRGVISDALSLINPIIGEFYEEKDSVNTELSQKKAALCVQIEENERLKQEKASLSALLKEKEKLAVDADFELAKQKEQFDLVYSELNLNRDQINKQEVIIANTKSELDMLKGKLDETFQQVHQKEVEISNLNQKLMIMSNALAEMERQNGILHNNIREKQEKLVSAITNDQEQNKKLESIVVSMSEFSKTILDFGCKLTQKIETHEPSHVNIREAKWQNGILHNNIREKQEKLVSAITNDQEQNKKLESIVVSMSEFSKTILDFGCKLTQKIETHEPRLNLLNHHCSQIKLQSNLLKRKVSWYKERFETRCEDLQKAEIEVDLLGDEVDTLLGLLGKIYMALDHYSPVLQHYPGVVEILKLIRREMDGETSKLG